MRANKQLGKKLNKRFAEKQDELDRRPAVMGDGAGNLYVTGFDNFVYVTMGDKAVPVFNNRVPPQTGLQVWVGYAAEEPTLFQVLATRSESPAGVQTGFVGYAPARRYEWMARNGGQDPLSVHLRAFTPLKLSVSPEGWMFVDLYRGFVYSGGAYIAVPRQNVDLYAQIPTTAGKAAFVLITIDTTGAVVQTKGSEVNIEDLVITDIPAVPAGTAFVCGAVRVYYGQLAIQEGRTNTDFVDLRFPGYAGGGLWQPLDAQLTDVAGLTPTDNGVIIGNGTNFVIESGSTLRTSLGLAIGSDVQAYDTDLAAIAALTPTDDDIIQRKAGAWANRTISQLVTDLQTVTDTLYIAKSLLTTRGDIITRSATIPQRLALGAAGSFLRSDGTDVVWSTGLIAITASKTLTVANSLTLSGTDGESLVLTKGLTVTTNAGTIDFSAAASTLTVPATGQALVATVGATVVGRIPYYSTITGSVTSTTNFVFDGSKLAVGTATPDASYRATLEGAGLLVNYSVNGIFDAFTLRNLNAGTSAGIRAGIVSDKGTLYFEAFSAAYTTANWTGKSGLLASSALNGIFLATPNIIQFDSSNTAVSGFIFNPTDGSFIGNEAGNANGDFRYETDSYDGIFLDASNNSIVLMSNAAGKLGFFGATAVVKGTAFTQTYSTAAHTITQTTMTDPAAYGAGANGYSTGAMASAIHAEVIALRANMIVTQNVLNGLIDDLQALGLV